MATVDDLKAYAASFQLLGVADGQQVLPGSLVRISLGTDALVPEVVTREIVSAPLALRLVSRHVQLASDVDDAVEGPWPLPINAVLATPLEQGVAEGYVTTITGDLPIGFKDTIDPLVVETEWHVTDDQGHEFLEGDSVRGTQPGQSPLELELLFAPSVATWVKHSDASLDEAVGDAAPTEYKIYAKIRLTTQRGGVTSDWVRIPVDDAEIPGVKVLRLPLPDAVFAFQAVNYEEHTLCILPSATPFSNDINHMLGLLRTLSDVVETLRFFARFVPVADAVSTLLDRLPGAGVTFDIKNKRGSLENINMAFGNGDWDDRISSLIGLSALHSLDFYSSEDLQQHRLSVMPWRDGGMGAVLVPNLHSQAPGAEPPGGINRNGAPDRGWGDTISSYEWNLED